MVLYPAVLLLLLFVVGCRRGVGGEVLVILSIPKRPGRSDSDREQELRATAWVELVVGRRSAERQSKVDIVGVTVGHEEVAPVLQHVTRVGELQRQHEVVVRPAQTLAPSDGDAEQLHILVGVVVVLVVVVIRATVAVEVVIIVVVVGAVVVSARHVGLLGVVNTDGELYRALSSEPVGGVAHVVRLVVGTVGLGGYREGLTVTDRHYSAVLGILLEQVGHREVVELQSYSADDTCLSPTEGELHLVVGFRLQVPVDVHCSVLIVGLYVGVDGFGVEMSHRCQVSSGTRQCLL